MSKVFFNDLPEIYCDGREHSHSDPSDIIAVEVSDRETISSSSPSPLSCKGLDPHRNFPIFGHS